MSYVPKEWHTSAYAHRLASHRVSWFKRLHTCICGASAWSARALWHEHVRIEQQIAHAMTILEENKAKRWRVKIDAEKAKMNEISARRAKLRGTGPYFE